MSEIEESIFLEDGIEYGIVDKINANNNEYLYLCNLDAPEEFCIRKVSGDDVIGLDDDNEFDVAYNLFRKKYEEGKN